MAKFVTIGERLSVTAPTVNKAFAARDEEPILKRAKQQLDAGAVYLDVNIGPAENDGEDIMKWAVELLQSNFAISLLLFFWESPIIIFSREKLPDTRVPPGFFMYYSSPFACRSFMNFTS